MAYIMYMVYSNNWHGLCFVGQSEPPLDMIPYYMTRSSYPQRSATSKHPTSQGSDMYAHVYKHTNAYTDAFGCSTLFS